MCPTHYYYCNYSCDRVKVKVKFKFTLLTLLFLEILTFGSVPWCWCFSLSDLLCQAPHLLGDFQQIVVFSGEKDNSSSASPLTWSSSSGNFLLEIPWTKSNSGKSSIILANFKEIDDEANSVVFFTAKDPTTLYQMIIEVAKSLEVPNPNAVNLDSDYSWNSFYFIVWPDILDLQTDQLENSNSTGQLQIFLQNLTQKRLFPLNTNIFAIVNHNNNNNTLAPNSKDRNSKNGGKEKRETTTNVFSVWEFYSIKDREFVHQVTEDISHPNFIYNLVRFKWKRRRDLHGVLLTATAVIDNSYENEARFVQYENGSYSDTLESGVAVSIYRIFRDHLNFSEKAVVGQYMLTNASDGHEPMDVYLKDGSADIAITESAVTHDKAMEVQFLHATLANWLEARFSQPPSSKWKFFLSPFSTSVWRVIGLHVFLMVISMVICRHVINIATISSSVSEIGGDDKSDLNLNVADIDLFPNTPMALALSTFWRHVSAAHLDFLWALGTLGQQGWYDWPSKTPMKILCLIGSMTGFLLFAAYSGTITSKLSVKEASTVTFDRLLNLSYEFYLENDFEFPVETKHANRNISVKTLWDDDDMLRAINNILVHNRKSVIISYPEFFSVCTTNANISSAVTCEKFIKIRVSQTPSLCAMAVRKASPLKEILNIKILYIWERGILPRFVSDYKRRTQMHCRTDSHILKPQHLSDLYLAFALIVSGTALSVAILFLENLVKILSKFVYIEFFV